MGKGRPWSRALRSKVTATGRWVPKTNSHAVCVGLKLAGQSGGGRAGVKERFMSASKACH
jgi:hypothetical protein